MAPEKNVVWIYERLRYYRGCLARFSMDSTESQYLQDRITEFEEHVTDIIREYFQIA